MFSDMHEEPSMSSATHASASRDVAARVAAVGVTFNRKTLLAECLDALLSQTRPLDCIFVIDQASTDGTREMLGERGWLELSQVRYCRSEVNTGGSGGFHRGMQMAHEAKFDWVWIMDDDAIADADALKNLLQYTKLPDLVAIANTKIRVDGTVDTGHFALAARTRCNSTKPLTLSFSSFVGLLVSCRAINSVGLPKAEFFLMYDDNEYSRRLRTIGKIALAEDAIILHKEASRPQLFAKRLGWTFPVIPWDTFCVRWFLYWRNRVWTEIHADKVDFASLAKLFILLFKTSIGICLVDGREAPSRLFIIQQAIVAGILGRFDNNFPFRMRFKVHRI
jgi:GT2 family glycosyltransferase